MFPSHDRKSRDSIIDELFGTHAEREIKLEKFNQAVDFLSSIGEDLTAYPMLKAMKHIQPDLDIDELCEKIINERREWNVTVANLERDYLLLVQRIDSAESYIELHEIMNNDIILSKWISTSI